MPTTDVTMTGKLIRDPVVRERVAFGHFVEDETDEFHNLVAFHPGIFGEVRNGDCVEVLGYFQDRDNAYGGGQQFVVNAIGVRNKGPVPVRGNNDIGASVNRIRSGVAAIDAAVEQLGKSIDGLAQLLEAHL